MEPERLGVPVGGTTVGALRWPGAAGTPTVVALHGITANAWSWAGVARHLDGAASLVAIDLRGRGASAGAPGPFGMRRHADDAAAVIEGLGLGPCVVAGHSMGAYVALMLAERHPALVTHLVLVDGGVALPLPDGLDVPAALDASLGPAIERLRTTYASPEEYRAMWARHPAFAAGLTPDVERYVLADLVERDGAWVSCVSEEAVRTDGAELLTDAEVRSLLDEAAPATVVRAETGLFAAPPPLIPVEVMEHHTRHRWVTVPGANHYTVLAGEQGAAVVAAEIVRALPS
jgi:pimeloyl-ACP methyl ester carboxylesterase